MTDAKHLLLTPHGYYLRVTVPKDLRVLLGKREIKKSLSTFDHSHAKKAARYIMLEIERVFSALRGVDIAKYQRPNLHIKDMVLRNFNENGRVCQELEMTVEEERKQLFPDFKLNPIRLPEPTVTTNFPARPKSIASESPDHRPVAPAITEGMLSKRAEQHLKEKKRKGISDNRLASLRTLYNMLINYFGDVPMRTITRDQAAEFIDILAVLPLGATSNRINEFKGKSLREIAEKTSNKIEALKQWKPGRKKCDHIKLLDASTINKYISEADSFWEWCVLQERDLPNPFGKQKIAQPKGKRREPFDVPQLETIFQHSIFTDHSRKGIMIVQEHHFFAPVIAIYSGLRIEEICQMHLDDIVQFHGIWVFDINRLHGKRLKNASSERRVPIHNDLIHFGLLEYAEELRREDETILFPGLRTEATAKASEKNAQKLSNNLSVWFHGLLVELKLKKDTLVFHSFRHTFANSYHQQLYNQPTVVKELLGHIYADITKDTYSSAYGLKIKKDTIDALTLGTDLTRDGFIKPWKSDDFRLSAALRRLRREANDPYLKVMRSDLVKAAERFFNPKPTPERRK